MEGMGSARAVGCGLWAEGGGCCSMLLRLLESYYCTEYQLLSM